MSVPICFFKDANSTKIQLKEDRRSQQGAMTSLQKESNSSQIMKTSKDIKFSNTWIDEPMRFLNNIQMK